VVVVLIVGEVVLAKARDRLDVLALNAAFARLPTSSALSGSIS
jgi:hypothetical protein